MSKTQIQALTNAELRAKYKAKKEKALKFPNCSMNWEGKKKLIRKFLPEPFQSNFLRLEEEYYRRFPFKPFKRGGGK
ncbi:MAG TPA: hypothetical protein VFA61_11905 [Candidatus Udaeobacter sp.]|nr:hypothetical protein [Candidatus Udaeobacter sp.]